jgi:transposase
MASASERDEWVRAAWRVTVAEVLEPERLVLVDEMGLHTSLAPLYGYAPKGERLRLSVPRNRGPNTTLLSSMTIEGMGPSMAVEGSTTAEVFEAYLEHYLVPELKPGQVVVMDNLDAHKPKRVKELIEDRGCQLLYLPAYSPDYNPIEEAFSKIKGTVTQGESPDTGDPARGGRPSAFCGQLPRRSRFFRACRIPSAGSTTVKRAIRPIHPHAWKGPAC